MGKEARLLRYDALQPCPRPSEIDLETKAKALAKCEIAGDHKTHRRWAKDPELIAFLRSL